MQNYKSSMEKILVLLLGLFFVFVFTMGATVMLFRMRGATGLSLCIFGFVFLSCCFIAGMWLFFNFDNLSKSRRSQKRCPPRLLIREKYRV